jgi:hypothetical protein
MLKTQLNIANETVAELTAKIQELEEALNATASPKSKKSSEDNWEESNFTKNE